MGKLQPPQACVHDHGALQAHRACRKPYPSCEGDSWFKESSSTQSTRRSNAPHTPNALGTRAVNTAPTRQGRSTRD